MKVQAAPGIQVPREDNPRKFITDSEPVELAEVSGYYIRRLAAGELVEVTSATSSKASTTSATSTSKKD